MKSITVISRSEKHASSVAKLFGIPVTGMTIEVPLTAIDKAIQSYLEEKSSAVAESILPKPTEPERIDKRLVLSPVEETQKTGIEAEFLANTIGADAEQKQAAYNNFIEAQRLLRQEVVLRAIRLDAEPDTLVYGLNIPGVSFIRWPDGIHRRCKTLIHGTHPVTPEEEYLRELQVTCDRIIRYYVPGLDDAAWQRLNQPVYWPMNPQDWRELCLRNYS
ncbi:MAG: hypothetical protein F6K42_02470 [Leptolyngbya sp. SIO1D8]|nr:hypothetical protein [Leptolyngbya sp. SIO1D8]